MGRVEHLGGQYGKIAGAGRHVKDVPGMKRWQLTDGLAPPIFINIPRQAMVQSVVGMGYVVEHSLYLLTFIDRKSTRLNSSHANISYAVFCLKKKKKYYEM